MHPAKRAPANWIWGWHSLEACIERYPELIKEVLLESNSIVGKRARDLLAETGLKYNDVKQLPADLGERRTQGVAARLSHFPTYSLRDYCSGSLADALKKPAAQFVVLDGVEDPRNYGAVLRSAAAFGVRAIFVGERHQAPLTGVVAQASAGQIFRLDVVSCSNIKQIFDLDEFVEVGAVSVALDAGGSTLPQLLGKIEAERPLIWVVGAEGEGLSPVLRQRCTHVARIPMSEGVESLNASVAAAIAFYSGSLRAAQ